jgi:DNA-binding NarL/FixJ family response regulator
MRSYNFNDGLYCSFRRWNCIFVSPQLLALAPGCRALLTVAAQFAVGRIEDLAMQPRKGRKTGNLLTPRECEVLQQVAVIGDNAGVAKALNISLVSVDTHLSKARKKLGVKSTGQALLTAFKNRLIEY